MEQLQFNYVQESDSFQIISSKISLSKKINNAIDLLRMYEPTALSFNPKGYHLSFSGGKDSVVIHSLALMAGVIFQSHHQLTTVDPPELVQFIKNHYKDTIINRPKESMWELIVRHKMPPTRMVRYCCSDLKEGAGTGSIVITGIRKAESPQRSQRDCLEIVTKNKKNKIYLNNDNDENRRIIENCNLKGKVVINPIIDWTDEDVWGFIKAYNIPYCELYDQGFCRLGCIGCPKASQANRIREFERWPIYKENYIRAFDRMIKARNEAGKVTQWQSGEEVFEWWVYRDRRKIKGFKGQIELAC